MSMRTVEFRNLAMFQDWMKMRIKWAKTLASDDMPSFTVMNLSPEMAKWLRETYNTRNRIKRPARIKELVSIIQNGKWKSHTQGMSMSTKDRLNNGQHRLWAIEIAGVPVVIQIAFNEPDEAFDALDSGEMKSVNDVALQRGITDAKGKSAGVKILMALEDEKVATQGKVSPPRVADWIEANSVIDEIFPYAQRVTKKLKSRQSAVVAAFHKIREANPAVSKVIEFFTHLELGGLPVGHPAHTLREALRDRYYDTSNKTKGEVAGADGAQGLLTAGAIINGWNRYVDKKTTTRAASFVWDPTNEPFPIPKKIYKE